MLIYLEFEFWLEKKNNWLNCEKMKDINLDLLYLLYIN